MSRKRDESGAAASQPAQQNIAFASLAALKGSLPEGRVAAAEATQPSRQGKLTIRRERKGRGGKTVTLVLGLEIENDALRVLARDLRQALGTGGSVEGNAIVLNGDQCQRVCEWLQVRGYERIVIGN